MTAIRGFVGGDNESFSRAFGYSTCVNLYPEYSKDQSSTTPSALFGTPGSIVIDKWFTPDASTEDGAGGRGIYTTSRGAKYSVIGESVYKYSTEDSDPVKVATIPYGTNPVHFADDGWYLCIVDGNSLYTIDMYSGVFGTPSLPTNVHPTHVCFLGGRIIINASTELVPASPGVAPLDTRLFYSALYKSNVWLTDGAGSFAAIASADPVLAIEVVNDQLIVCGSRTIEFFSVTDDADNPFIRVSGSSSANGIFAPQSLVTIGKSSYWLGMVTNGSVQVYRNNGYDIENISTPAIEWKFATAGNNAPTDAIGSTYSQAGHTFYILTSKYLNITYVFDVEVGEWHRRTTRDESGNENYWRYLYFAADRGKIFSQTDDYLGVLKIDLETYREFDNRTITRERTTTIMQDELSGIVHDYFVLLMETGTGNSAGEDDKDPLAQLSWSDDGNDNFTPETSAMIGNDGAGGRRVKWWRLGYSIQRSYRVRITAPVRVVLLDAFVNSEPTGR